MYSHDTNISILIQELDSINYSAVVPIIQAGIEMESTNKSANDILNNDIEFLTSDYRISQAEKLLSLLRRSHGL
jgi:hypothetical protein